MARTLKTFRYQASDSGKVMITCTIDDNGNEMSSSTEIVPDKDGAAHLKHLSDWIAAYLKTKYGAA